MTEPTLPHILAVVVGSPLAMVALFALTGLI